MTVHRLHASYILRLRQRLSRLSYELRDVRTGQARLFDDSRALASFLEGTLAQTCHEAAPQAPDAGPPEAGPPAWNALGTAGRQAEGVDEQK